MPLNIVSVLPDVSSTGVILQGAVIVTFDEEIDTTTYSEQSFLVSAPAENGPGRKPAIGLEYVQGAFSFAINTAGATIATFKPSRPLRPNVQYTVLITPDVQALDGTPLASAYTWNFTTGVLNLTVPPLQNPLPSQVGRIKPSDVKVTPHNPTGNDLTQQIVLTFPAPIDPTSFQLNQVLVDLEAFLQDPEVDVPAGATITASLGAGSAANTLIISITGIG